MAWHLIYLLQAPTAASPGPVPHRLRCACSLRRVLLPASTLVPALPALPLELWELLKLLPYTTRYRMYADLRVSLHA